MRSDTIMLTIIGSIVIITSAVLAYRDQGWTGVGEFYLGMAFIYAVLILLMTGYWVYRALFHGGWVDWRRQRTLEALGLSLFAPIWPIGLVVTASRMTVYD